MRDSAAASAQYGRRRRRRQHRLRRRLNGIQRAQFGPGRDRVCACRRPFQQSFVRDGGLVAIDDDGSVLAELALPIAGLMSDRSIPEVADSLQALDAAARDLRLQPDSPALKLGFQQTDLSKVGLYGARSWTSLPKKAKHAPIAPQPGPGSFLWTYENEVAGAAPVHSGQLAPGPDECQHRIEVIDTDAASGTRSLKLVEGQNSERSFFPFLHYPIGIESGHLRASFRLKLPSATPSAFYFSFRDYHNTGSGYFQTGPHIEVNAKGMLTTPKMPELQIPLSRDTWVSIEMTFTVGEGAAKTFDLTTTIPGQAPKTVRRLPYKHTPFAQVGDLYIVSTGPDGGAFLLDDVQVSVETARP